MEKETMGTVISVTKQWWLKVNRIFDLDSMRKGCAIHSMSADRFTIHF